MKELSPTDLWSGVKGRGSITLGGPGGLEADSDPRDNCTSSELQLLKLGAKDCFMPLHSLTMPLTLPEVGPCYEVYYPSVSWSSFSQRLCDVFVISSGSYWLINSAAVSISGTKILFYLFRLLLIIMIIMNMHFIMPIFSVHNIYNLLSYGTRSW